MSEAFVIHLGFSSLVLSGLLNEAAACGAHLVSLSIQRLALPPVFPCLVACLHAKGLHVAEVIAAGWSVGLPQHALALQRLNCSCLLAALVDGGHADAARVRALHPFKG